MARAAAAREVLMVPVQMAGRVPQGFPQAVVVVEAGEVAQGAILLKIVSAATAEIIPGAPGTVPAAY
jgi:hypothetical protein